VVSAVVTIALVGFSRLFDDSIDRVSTDVVRLVRTIPDGLAFALVGIVQIIVTVAVPAAVFWLVVKRRWRILGLGVFAALAGGLAMAVLGGLLDSDVPAALQRSRVVESWLSGSAYPSAALLAAGAAVITAFAPFVPRNWNRIATFSIGGVALLRVLTATEIPMNLLLILAVGSLMGSVALVVSGAPPRRVDPDTIGDTLSGAGLEIAAVEPYGDERTAPSFRVRHPGGAESYAVLLGRDQRDQDLVLRAWRALRLKGFHARRPIGSPRRAVENEQLILAFAQSAGVGTSRPVTIGITDDGAVVGATSWVEGTSLGRLGEQAITDGLLAATWREVAKLHARRIAHGWLNVDSVLVDQGRPHVVGFRWAATNASSQTLSADVAELLCSLAVHVGIDRSVASAVQGLGTDRMAAVLPLLQPLVISGRTRDDLKAALVGLVAVRDAFQQAVGADSVELAPVSRVSLKGVVSLVGSIVLAYYVFSLASDWRSIADAFGDMDWAAVPLLVALVLTINSGGALSLMGSVNVDLPFMRTSQIMFAQGFLNRFTPANAGGMALRARYLQREGVDLTVGAAAVGLTSAVSGVVQAVFIVVFLIWGGAADQLSRFELPSATKTLGILIAIGAVIGALVLSAWGRRVVVPWVKRTVGPALASFAVLARQPRKLAQLVGGAALSKLATIAAFALTISAMGVTMDFSQVGALYMVASTVGAAVPTPGGVGGIEAALTAALISAGVDPATAGAIVLIFRLFTFWFPTLPGWAFLQRVQRNGVV
jgi:undecaprenyl-diphosphatase